MKPNTQCARCEAAMPAQTPEGLCPKCLLAAGFLSDDSNSTTIQAPAAAEAETQGGEIGAKPSPRHVENRVLVAGSKVKYFGDYEMLEKIAQGGMGVVYQARQVSLNRVVAVKMILSGQLASETDIKRFHQEAEAAANLQHPNIVAIHEVGEHEGRHYFSMDFVDGPSLATGAKSGPMPAIDAAALVKTLAEAIQYAHQRGILHRDLKPHNVLIDSRGVPRITDFGLAKRLEQDSGLTTEGSVMGSPSYMSPEQAAGRQDLTGPTSDVYSLGAILYELLTGRPPFCGKTAMETVRQVIEHDPVPPSKLNAKVPADLETICLKCLEKRPEQRYSSARLMAEELERFLKHEPILARPASAARKAGARMQRHPWIITALLAVVVLGVSGLAFGFWDQSRHLVWLQTHTVPAKSEDEAWFVVSTVLVIVFGAIGVAPGFFFDFVDRKRRRFALRNRHLKIYAGFGLFALAVAVNFTLALVHEWIWHGLDRDEQTKLPMFALACFSCAWFGGLLLLNVVKEYRSLQFGVERKDEEVLFPPVPKEVMITLGQRRAVNLMMLAGFMSWAVITQSTALLARQAIAASFLFMNSLFVAVAIPAFFLWRGTRNAGKHALFFGAVLSLVFAGMGAFKLSHDPIFQGTFHLPDAPWIASGLGLALGVFIEWAIRRARALKNADTTAETVRYNPWVMANEGPLALLLPGYFLLLLANRFWSGSVEHSWHYTALFTAVMLMEITLFRQASGPERQARGQTITVCVVITLASCLGLSLNQIMREVLAGSLLGASVLGFAAWKNQQLQARALRANSP